MSCILNTKMCALLRFECGDVHVLANASMFHLHSFVTHLFLLHLSLSFVVDTIWKANGRKNVSILESIRSKMCMFRVCTNENERENVIEIEWANEWIKSIECVRLWKSGNSLLLYYARRERAKHEFTVFDRHTLTSQPGSSNQPHTLSRSIRSRKIL